MDTERDFSHTLRTAEATVCTDCTSAALPNDRTMSSAQGGPLHTAPSPRLLVGRGGSGSIRPRLRPQSGHGQAQFSQRHRHTDF